MFPGSWLARLAAKPFYRLYHGWNQAHAAVVVLLVAAAEIPAARSGALVALAAWCPLALLALYRAARRFHPDGAGALLPNLLTSTRVVAAGALVALTAVSTYQPGVGQALRSSSGFVALGILLAVELTDLFDGLAARRGAPSRFGATWDMESDSVFAIALAVTLRHVHGAGLPVLAIGLMRYLYVLAWRYDGDPVGTPKVYKMYAKTTAAIIITTLILGMAPVLGAGVRTATYLVVLALQLVSFGWDLVIQRRAARHGRP